MNTRFLLLPLLLSLAACSGSGDDMHPDDAALLAQQGSDAAATAPAGAEPAAPVTAQESSVEQVTLANDGVAVGSALGAEGAVANAKPAYAATDTVYASVPVGGYAAKDVAIYWFASNGTSLKEERKPIPAGAKFVNFSLSQADGMKPGTYTAQADIGDTPVGMADFTVK